MKYLQITFWRNFENFMSEGFYFRIPRDSSFFKKYFSVTKLSMQNISVVLNVFGVTYLKVTREHSLAKFISEISMAHRFPFLLKIDLRLF